MKGPGTNWPPTTLRELLQWAADRYTDAEAVPHADRRFSSAGSSRRPAGWRPGSPEPVTVTFDAVTPDVTLPRFRPA